MWILDGHGGFANLLCHFTACQPQKPQAWQPTQALGKLQESEAVQRPRKESYVRIHLRLRRLSRDQCLGAPTLPALENQFVARFLHYNQLKKTGV